MAAISVEELTRGYMTRAGRKGGKDGRIALDGVTLHVEQGEIHGLLGPNGAGKTTLVKILATILTPSAGRATVMGYDVVREAKVVRRSVGLVLGGDRGHYNALTAEQNLRFWAAMYGCSGAAATRRVRALLDRFGLSDRAGSRVETFSRGMKQRLHLARGLVGGSPVLVLDEPTVGMDPVAAREFREITRELAREGRTLLITTHDMAEAEEVCDRVTLIDDGRVLATESPASLGALVSRFEHVDVTGITAAALAAVRELPGVAEVSEVSTGAHRVLATEANTTALVLECLLRHRVTGVSVGRPSLAEVYLHLVGGDRGMRV